MMQDRAIRGAAIVISDRAMEKQDRAIDGVRLHREMMAAAAVRAAPDSPWFALRCALGREMAVENQAAGYGIEAFVPVRKGREYRRRGRIMPSRLEPVFNGYVFLRFILEAETIAAIMGLDHALELVGGNYQPARVAHAEVLEIKAKAEAGAYDWQEVCAMRFRVGERVMVTAGVFGGRPHEIVAIRSDGRGDAVVQLTIYGRPTAYNIPLAFLEKL